LRSLSKVYSNAASHGLAVITDNTTAARELSNDTPVESSATMLYPTRYHSIIPQLVRRGLLQSKNCTQLVCSPDAVAVVVTHAHHDNQTGPLFMVTLELAVVHVRTVHDNVLASRRALASIIRTRGSTKYLEDLTGSISTWNGFLPLFDLVLFGCTASISQFRELIPSASDRAQLLHSIRVTGADKTVYVVSSIDRGVAFVVQVADSGDTNEAQTPRTTAFDSGSSTGDASGFISCVMYKKYTRFTMPWTPMRSDKWRAAWPEAVDDAYAKNEAWRFRLGMACCS
jgi:hypothetical protein